jgi:hypothetical protein
MIEFVIAVAVGVVFCGGSFVFGVLFGRKNPKLVNTVVSTATTAATAVKAATK